MTDLLHLFDIPHLITTYGYAGIFIIVFLESGIFFALPGDSLLFTAGLFAKSFGLSLWYLILLIYIATVTGTMVGYHIGYNLKKLHHYSFFKKVIKKHHLDKAHDFFERHGKMAVSFSHFFPIFRTFVPIVAGIAEMKYSTFIVYTLISSFVWAGGVTMAGYFFGQIFPQAADYLWVIVVLTVLVSSLPVLWEMVRRRKKKHP